MRRSDPEPDPHADAPQPTVDSDDYLFYLILHCARRREAAMAEALAGLDMTVAKWRVLSVIYRLDGCTMGELAEFTAVDRTTTTRTLDQLCAEGRVRRIEDPTDRRRVRLSLTPEGVGLRHACSRISRALARRHLADISEADRAAVSAIMRTLIEAMTPDAEVARQVITLRRPELERA